MSDLPSICWNLKRRMLGIIGLPRHKYPELAVNSAMYAQLLSTNKHVLECVTGVLHLPCMGTTAHTAAVFVEGTLTQMSRQDASRDSTGAIMDTDGIH